MRSFLSLSAVLAMGVTVTHAFSNPRMSLSVGESFPPHALKRFGLSGKKCVVYFYGADEAPTCTKQAAAFESLREDFEALGVTVCGVRNEGGVKATFTEKYGLKFAIDEQNAVREEIGIPNDLFGLLGGRETYLVDRKGQVRFMYQGQFNVAEHASEALAAAKETFPVQTKNAFKFEMPVLRPLSARFPKELTKSGSDPATIRPNQAHRPQRITIEVS